mgnify:CR=1 FL=1
MTQKSSSHLAGRAQFVASSSGCFLLAMSDKLTLQDLTDFANNAETHALEAEKEMVEYFCGNNNEWDLHVHAGHMRTVAAKIILLRNGLIPALNVDRNNPILWMQAVHAMGYIDAEIKATECFMR